MATRVRVLDSKKPRSPDGTPSSAAMTSDGTGRANSVTRSAASPWASIASMHSSTVRWMAGRSARMRRCENSGMSTLRTGPCSGGSRHSQRRPEIREALPVGVRADPRVGEDGADIGLPGHQPDHLAVCDPGLHQTALPTVIGVLGRRERRPGPPEREFDHFRLSVRHRQLPLKRIAIYRREARAASGTTQSHGPAREIPSLLRGPMGAVYTGRHCRVTTQRVLCLTRTLFQVIRIYPGRPPLTEQSHGVGLRDEGGPVIDLEFPQQDVHVVLDAATAQVEV